MITVLAFVQAVKLPMKNQHERKLILLPREKLVLLVSEKIKKRAKGMPWI